MRLVDVKVLEKQTKEAFKENPVVMGMLLRWFRKQPTVDAVPVVRCRECVLSGNCSAEDTFRLVAGIDDPYCCVGKPKESKGK